MPHISSLVRVPAAGRSAARSSLPPSRSDTSSTTTAARSKHSSSPRHLQNQVHGAASSSQRPHRDLSNAWLTGDPLQTHVQPAGWAGMLHPERSPTTTKDTSTGATNCGNTSGAACASVLGAEAPTWLGKGHMHGLCNPSAAQTTW